MSNRPRWYIWQNGVAVAVPMETWATWKRGEDADVGKWQGTNPADASSPILVSTVFLGLDHALSGPPVLWETMIF